MMYTSYLKTVIGLLAVIGDESSVYYIRRTDRIRTNQHSAATEMMAGQLAEYFDGRRKEFTVPIVISGTPFQKEVYQALHDQVAFGQTISYKQLAAACGHPNASRAVGQAMNKNGLLIVVPCHRVIAADGTLGGFGLGLPAKKKLLAIEHPLTPQMKEKLKGWL